MSVLIKPQQAAVNKIASLRLRLSQQATGENSSTQRASRLQHIHLQAYQAQVREQVIAAWLLPLLPAQTRDLHSRVLLRVGRSGEVTDLQLLQASGHARFDTSFMRAIRRVLPLPALPVDYEGEFLDIELHFRLPDA